MDPAVLDRIIEKLIEVRSSKPGKLVQLSESEIKQLCVASREIFISQPNLLELEAPIKICGIFLLLLLFSFPENFILFVICVCFRFWFKFLGGIFLVVEVLNFNGVFGSCVALGFYVFEGFSTLCLMLCIIITSSEFLFIFLFDGWFVIDP